MTNSPRNDGNGGRRFAAEVALRGYAAHPYQSLNDEGEIVMVNDAWIDVLGYERADVTGKWFGDLLAEESAERFESLFQDFDEGGGASDIELDVEHADGYTIPVSFSGKSECGGDATGRRVHCQFNPVTESKERERALERYERFVENLLIGVYQNTPGPDGPFMLVNDAMVEMFDANSKADLREHTVSDLYAEADDRAAFSALLADHAIVKSKERRLETLSGEAIWGAVMAIAMEVDGNTVFDGAIQDITEREEMETRLRRREERFRTMFERHSAPMLLIEPETGSIQRANEAATAFYGYSTDELTSMNIQQINRLSPEEVALERERAERGDRNYFIFDHELAGGEIRTVEVNSSPIDIGDEMLLFSIIHDITERVEYERRIENQRDNLDVLNQVLRHDIRNDLQLVSAYTELLADHCDGEGEEYIEPVLDSAEHAVDLTTTARQISDVMLASEVDCHRVDLQKTLTSEVEKVRLSYPDARISVDGTIPDVRVMANDMLESVFRNLLKNAIQHNDASVPEVIVSGRERDDDVVVRVADNGPGVPDTQKDDIFGKGEKGLESEGTGVGLYLVQTLVDDYGGSVWVDDNEPTGAIFVVTLQKGGR